MPTTNQLREGRAAFDRSDWTQAYEALSAAISEGHGDPSDLRRTAEAAILTGHTHEGIAYFEQAHRAYLDTDAVGPAVRCAFWAGLQLAYRGEHAPAMGWFGRGQRLLEEAGGDVVEHGYLMLPAALGELEGGDPASALSNFEELTSIADRFGDADLRALGRLGQGQALVALGQVGDGISMLDDAMIEVTASDVSPLAAGIVYCGLVISCRKVFDVRRAQEWTAALSRWCERQEGLKPYQGQCFVHRSEIMQLRGDWSDALAEIEAAFAHLADPPGDPVMGMAQYQRGELLRLRGEYQRAEDCYREAAEWGHAVQPGLALLRSSQGRLDEAEAALRRVVAEAETDRVRRSQVLAAFSEIMLATGDVVAAREATEELEEIAADFGAPYLHTVAASSRGAILLTESEPAAALVALREALQGWQQLDAPYEAASVRLRMAEACRALGDDDTAQVELHAARRVFEELGAAPAATRARELSGDGDDGAPGGLTPRELEVLELVATGATNRTIADDLVISERTVDRHVSNIFTKLGISSRAAATAWAYEHDLV